MEVRGRKFVSLFFGTSGRSGAKNGTVANSV